MSAHEDAASARRVALVAAAVAVAWTVVWVAAADRFGPTLDAAYLEYPLGERVLAYVLGRPVVEGVGAPAGSYSEHLSWPTPPFRSRAPHPRFRTPRAWYTTWPMTPALSAASCEIFWTRLGALKPFVAHHLPVGLASAALAALVALAAGRPLGIAAAVFAPAFLLMSPRFCADAFNNLKDVPEAFLYFAALLAWRAAFLRGRIGRWAGAGALSGLALAQKSNGLFLFPHAVVAFVVLRRFGPRDIRPRAPAPAVLVAVAALLAAYFAGSPQYWSDPWPALRDHFRHVFAWGGPSLDRGLGGLMSQVSGDAALVFLLTTPPALLAAGALGLFNRRMAPRDRAFFALGAALPILRTALPGMSNYDGVRHFWEFHPSLCVLGAAGADLAMRAAARFAARVGGRASVAAAAAAALVFLAPTAAALQAVMPDGTVYFNSLGGGLPGARRRGDADATDYWMNGYWRAMEWLDAHAESGARVVAPLSPEVAECAAPLKLRPDLLLDPPDGVGTGAPAYVMYVTRDAWYPKALAELDAASAPAYVREVDGAPVLKIVRVPAGADADRAVDALRGAARGEDAKQALIRWIGSDKRRYFALAEVVARPLTIPEKVVELKKILPPSFNGDLDAFLRYVWR